MLSYQQIEHIISQIDLSQPDGLRDRAIIETFYSCGLRASEMIGLALSDINLSAGTLLVRQGKGRKDRLIPLGARAAKWIARYIQHQRPVQAQALFVSKQGRAISASTYYAYNAWGMPLVKQESGVGNRFTWQSNWIELKDSGGELLLAPFRVYSTVDARFLQRNLLGFVDGLNLYEAFGESPINWADPLGSDKKYRGKPDFISNPGNYIKQNIAGLQGGKFTLYLHKETKHQKGKSRIGGRELVSFNRQFIVEHTHLDNDCDSIAFIQLIRRRYGGEINRKTEDDNWGQPAVARLTYRGFGIDRGNNANTPLYGMRRQRKGYTSTTAGIGDKNYTPWFIDNPGMIKKKADAKRPGIDFIVFAVCFKCKNGIISARIIDIFALRLDLNKSNRVDIRSANVANLLEVSDNIYGEAVEELDVAGGKWNNQYKNIKYIDKLWLEY